jgi:sortase (surface protein transpeptidase)
VTKTRGSRSSPRAATVIASLLAIVGVVVLVVALRAQRSAPEPGASAAGTIVVPSTPAKTAPHPTAARPKRTRSARADLPASVPVAVRIPSIGVRSELISLGRNTDGSVQVPDSFQVAGWYDHSVTPGQVGPTVIVGHVDSKSGPGIFFRLGAMRPGDQVVVTRRDGRLVTYKITAVREYSKTAFPTIDVYGDTPVPTIRLVTCGGAFDSTTGHYLSNIVAYGQLG